MARVRIRSCRLAMVASLLASPSALAAGESAVLVRRVLWPVQIDAPRDAPDACDGLTPGDLRIEEDGLAVAVTAVERRPASILHGLLLDTSSSMLEDDRLESAKIAAAHYVRAVPPDEPVFVATFSNDLVLAVAPTLDREAALAAIERIGVGDRTALWDALRETLGALRVHPGTKVLLLLSDGADSTSLFVPTERELLELAAATPDLTLFSIAIDLGSGRGGLNARARRTLRGVAEITGGRFFETRSAHRLERIFEEIRGAVSRRVYASYEPPPFGAGPHDPPRADGSRWRRVEVRGRPDLGCDVASAGPPRRLERSPQVRPEELPVVDPAELLAVLDPCVEERLRGIVERIPIAEPPWRGDSGPGVLLVPAGPPWLAGWFPDVLRDRGASLVARRGGASYRVRYRGAAEVVPRPFAVLYPELDRVRRELLSAEDAVEALLDLRCSGDSIEPLLVHGKTFFELRGAIARAIHDHRPDFREWAAARILEERRDEARRLVRSLRSDPRWPDARLVELERAVLEAPPSPAALERHLAAWLGDVDAVEVARRLEQRWIDRALRAPGDGDAEARWTRLRAWFPAESAVRLRAPLIPAYDATREVVGFHRIVLPQVGAAGWKSLPLPAAPLGLQVARWVVPWPNEDLRVASVEYAEPSLHEVRDVRDRMRANGLRGDDPIRVRVVLEEREGPGAVQLVAYAAAHAAEPEAFGVCMRGEAAGSLAAIIERARAHARWVALPCESAPGAD